MLIRKSSQGHDLKLYRNTTPSSTRTKKYPDGTIETLSDNWHTIEQAYVDKCEDEHGGGTGRMLIGKHELVNNVIKEI
jgi:hypothetical protein